MKKRLLSFLLIPMLLTGCSSNLKLQFVPLKSYVEAKDLMRNYEDEYLYSKKETTPVTYSNDKTINDLRDLLLVNRSGYERKNILPTGERKLLVVPVYFTDSDTSTHEKKTIFIQNAFFGDTSHTNYDSVAGYYNKSSYGQLKLTGEVAPWYNTGKSSKEWANYTHTVASNNIACQAIDYLKTHSDIDFSQYDLDDDNNIDGVYIIYDHPQEDNTSNSLFWAYTYYTHPNDDGYNTTEPYLNNYSWTSVETIIQKDNRSYTNYLIHETGHLFGLTDYYNTLSSSKTSYHYQPTGCFDMMDYNIGDHSALSKYLLKWSSPLVTKKGNYTVKLKPLNSSGEYLLVPSSKYNNSPFSEYLLIEYFAPTGLNNYSGTFSYVDKNGNSGIYRYPQHYGLKIYHVNATLGYFVKGNNTNLICTIDDPDWESKTNGKTVGLDYAYTNSLSDSDAEKGSPTFYHLLESSGSNSFIDGVPANNGTLFKVGDDFGITKFVDYKFSNGEAVNFTLKVEKINSKEITLNIVKG